jgi:hypothetical protein
MNNINQMIIWFLILFFVHHLNVAFVPILADYDAYGLKSAMNERFLVEAQNDNYPPSFCGTHI